MGVSKTTRRGLGSTSAAAAYVGRNPVIASMVYTDGNLASWTEDGVAYSATYNSDGTVATLTVGTVTRTFSYDGSGNLTGAA